MFSVSSTDFSIHNGLLQQILATKFGSTTRVLKPYAIVPDAKSGDGLRPCPVSVAWESPYPPRTTIFSERFHPNPGTHANPSRGSHAFQSIGVM